MLTNVLILVVHERYETVTQLVNLLHQNGYGVWWSRTCREARLVAATYPIDVLITDVGLPDGDGCHLLAELRAIYSRMRGIAYTGAAVGQPDRARLVAAGFQSVLDEPARNDDVCRAVFDAVAASRHVGSPGPSMAITCA